MAEASIMEQWSEIDRRHNLSRLISDLSRQLPSENSSLIIEQILAWTGGQPTLTQRAFQLIIDSRSLIDSEDPRTAINHLIQAHFTPKILWSKDTADLEVVKHFREIDEALQSDRKQAFQLYQCYEQILLSGRISSDHSSFSEQELIRIGLVIYDQQGKVKVANPIYKNIFDQRWLAQKRSERRQRFDAIYYVSAILLASIFFVGFRNFFQRTLQPPLAQCEAEFLETAKKANDSLNENQMRIVMNQLQNLQRSHPETPSQNCAEILNELQYNYAIYVKAGIHNNPIHAVEFLCQIPATYYAERNIKPWFRRWSNLYKKSSFPNQLADYLNQHTCPAAQFLNRSI